jgi:hypothetical protein
MLRRPLVVRYLVVGLAGGILGWFQGCHTPQMPYGRALGALLGVVVFVVGMMAIEDIDRRLKKPPEDK